MLGCHVSIGIALDQDLAASHVGNASASISLYNSAQRCTRKDNDHQHVESWVAGGKNGCYPQATWLRVAEAPWRHGSSEARGHTKEIGNGSFRPRILSSILVGIWGTWVRPGAWIWLGHCRFDLDP
jgi:hypothetical protein